jgi:integrase/recombinase XerC
MSERSAENLNNLPDSAPQESAVSAAAAGGAVHTVKDASEEFLLYLETVRGMSLNTVSAYRNDLIQFAIMQGIGTDRDMAAISAEDIRGCIAFLSKEKRAASSINRFIASVRSLFAYCRKFQYIQVDPALDVKTVKIPKVLPHFMTGAEVDKLCAAPEKKELLWEKRDHALLEMLYSSGCRISEIASLTLEDISGDYSSAVVTGKGKKDRRVYFEQDARNALTAYLDDRKKRFAKSDPHVFVNQNGSALSVRGMRWIIDRYSGPEGPNHHVNPHAFRHTFATAMLTGGADVRLVQELLGHASISTTQRYTHITTDRLIAEYNKAHPHGGNKDK